MVAWRVFQSYRGGNWDIYRLRVADGHTERLTDHPADEASPAWSPNEDWIAFMSLRDGDWDVYRMRPDGSEVMNLSDAEANVFSPRWSPDGAWIGVYYNSRSIKKVTHIIHPDGSAWQAVDEDPAPAWEAASLPRFEQPWAPGWALAGGLLALLGAGLAGRRLGWRVII
ncbi:MAG: hypothetical protein HC915_02700 [Anaerolineae bacterium]|nr:hypothetical protein [Anaerolineae bacterium]